MAATAAADGQWNAERLRTDRRVDESGHSGSMTTDDRAALLSARSSLSSIEVEPQAKTNVVVADHRDVYTITGDSLPSHMRSLLPSHEQHVHDLLTLERTRKRLRCLITSLMIMLALTVLVAMTLVFSLKVKPESDAASANRITVSGASPKKEQVHQVASQVQVTLLGDDPRPQWTSYSHRAAQKPWTPCVTECWSYAAFRFRSTCDEGFCRCHGQHYDTYTCLPMYHNCNIEKNPQHDAAVKLLGKNQTTFSCRQTPRDDSVHVVSIFGNHRASTTHVTIKDQSPTSKTLVLVNYHFVKWTLHLPEASGISKVLLVSTKRYSQAALQQLISFPQPTSPSHQDPPVVLAHRLSLTGYGDDRHGGHTPQLLQFVEREVGPVTSFLGASHADDITLDLNADDDDDDTTDGTSTESGRDVTTL